MAATRRLRTRTPLFLLLVFLSVLLGSVPVRSESTNVNVSVSQAQRPRIGLCLAGGGAKGMAHVGVLRVLEEMRIPIDYIGGASMGSIVAGLYASGMTPDELEHFFVSQNWWDLMQDKTPRRELIYRRKNDAVRYILDFELGLKGTKVVMPNAFAAGQKLNNVLTAETAHVGTVSDFDKLPTPFRAVATDLHSGEAVVLDRGNLALSMRASMAIPGFFTPVSIDDHLLVDGGVVMNIPVEVVYDMGADIVIAVDVSGNMNWTSRKREFNSAGAIVGQTMAIFQRPGQEEQLAKADLVIDANVAPYDTGDFHQGAVIIPMGEKAARARASDLKAFQLSPEEYDAFMQKRQRQPVENPIIRKVTVTGNKRVDTRIIESKVATVAGDPLEIARVDRDAARIYGLSDFVTVLHLIEPTDQGYDLNYRVEEKPWGPGYLHLGMRFETDFDNHAYWYMLLNYTRRNINSLGAEWLLDLYAGRNKGVFTDFYQPLDFSGTFFVDPSFEITSSKVDVYRNRDLIAEYEMDTVGGAIDTGASLSDFGELRIGYFGAEMSATVAAGDSELPEFDGFAAGVQASFILDRLDHPYFARRGYYFSVGGRVAREELGSDVDYEKGEALYSLFGSLNNHTGWIRLRAGSAFNSQLPVYDQFVMGGIQDFAALSPGQLRGMHVGIGTLGYRYRIGRLPPGLGHGVYLGARGDVGSMWDDQDDISSEDVHYSGMLSVAADTVVGPLYLGGAWADDGNNRAFMSLGTQF